MAGLRIQRSWTKRGVCLKIEKNTIGVEVGWAHGSKGHPPVKPPPEPEKKTPPIGPPKRDPQPEPIKDPPVPPLPGKDPAEDPQPIGDPPEQSDQPIRMGVTFPMLTSPYDQEGGGRLLVSGEIHVEDMGVPCCLSVQ
jgi:hypothetical protein